MAGTAPGHYVGQMDGEAPPEPGDRQRLGGRIRPAVPAGPAVIDRRGLVPYNSRGIRSGRGLDAEEVGGTSPSYVWED